MRPRIATEIEIREAPDGKAVPIYGQTYSSHPQTPTHNPTMNRLAREFAESGQYEYLSRERSLKVVLEGISDDTRLPDIVGVRRDGRIDLFEVVSNSQTEQELFEKLENMRSLLPPELQGDIRVFFPDPE